MAAEIFAGALIIFKGLSSSKTKFKALSTGGTYFSLSSVEYNKFLFLSIMWISSTSLISFCVFRNLEYSFV